MIAGFKLGVVLIGYIDPCAQRRTRVLLQRFDRDRRYCMVTFEMERGERVSSEAEASTGDAAVREDEL